MANEEPRTLSDVIAQHQEWMRYGEYLLGEQTKCQRSESEAYLKIREAIEAVGVRDAAIVDQKNQMVYFIGDDGLVWNRRLVYADNINLNQVVLQEIESVVELGVAS